VILLSDKIKKIKSDRSSGASQIARNALGVLKFFAQTSKIETCRGFIGAFSELGRMLFDMRHNMAPVQNLVARIVYEIHSLDEDNLVKVRNFAVSRIDALCKESDAAAKKTAEWAASKIGYSDFLATCSYSSTICETFRIAKNKGKRFKVFIAESKSDDDKLRYGQVVANFLESIDVSAEVFPDDEIYRYVPKTNCVLVGADSVLFDGSIINGCPTYGVAVEAADSGVPFFSVCESIKANSMSYLGKNIEAEKGFDLVPSNLITGIITEKGILDFQEIVEVMKDNSKFFQVFNVV
jgi:translation initiation factor eIF-2B subunit delta